MLLVLSAGQGQLGVAGPDHRVRHAKASVKHGTGLNGGAPVQGQKKHGIAEERASCLGWVNLSGASSWYHRLRC